MKDSYRREEREGCPPEPSLSEVARSLEGKERLTYNTADPWVDYYREKFRLEVRKIQYCCSKQGVRAPAPPSVSEAGLSQEELFFLYRRLLAVLYKVEDECAIYPSEEVDWYFWFAENAVSFCFRLFPVLFFSEVGAFLVILCGNALKHLPLGLGGGLLVAVIWTAFTFKRVRDPVPPDCD